MVMINFSVPGRWITTDYPCTVGNLKEAFNGGDYEVARVVMDEEVLSDTKVLEGLNNAPIRIIMRGEASNARGAEVDASNAKGASGSEEDASDSEDDGSDSEESFGSSEEDFGSSEDEDEKNIFHITTP